jgi:predicted membrane-bound spermidine synthase
MLVLLLFFCSGATALVYEVLWSKYLSLILGSTVQAQTVVLAVFMGGLALGNRLFGRRSASFESPVLVYGILEMIIGIYAFFFPKLYAAADTAFVAIGSNFSTATFLLFCLKLTISILLLLLPTVLMGGTLPLLASWIQRQPGIESGARVGIFYATNSLGAVFGAGLAGFVLVQSLGTVSSLELTGLFNVGIGVAGFILGKRELLYETRPGPSPAAIAPAGPALAQAPFRFGLLVGFTGAVSMGLEVLFARALAMIAGGSLQAFAIVLMSFILGIGLGSAAISSMSVARRNGVNSICILLLGAAAIVVVNIMFIEDWVLLYSQAKYGLAANPIGFRWHQAALAVMSFIVLGLPAAFLGAVVPLSIQLLQGAAGRGLELGDQVGRLLTANTIGAVTGVLVTGFVLMPLLGLRAAIALLALTLMAVAGWLAYRRSHNRVSTFATGLAALSFLGILSTGDNWQETFSSGIFRLRNVFLTREWLEMRKQRSNLLYYKDSADATVSVEKSNDASDRGQTTLRINGKTDASSVGDLSTQYLLAHLPMMAKPDAKKVFVLGFGSGVTAGSLLGHPIEQVTIAENCGPVLEASVFFKDLNRGVLTNSRTRIFADDARAVLKLNRDQYDIIISEPSNPWVAGIGSVFTREFYQIAASRLTEGGIMAQWFHKYEMSDNIVYVVLRTFAAVFPHMEIWDTQDGDIVLLGSLQPWESGPAQFQKIFERPEARKDLAAVGLESAVGMWIRQIASQRTAFAIPGDGPIQTDEFPLLEYHAPAAFFIGQQANQLYHFDERTLQFPLADPAKVRVMRALPERVLLDAFSYYGSSNPDMKMYHQHLVNVATGGAGRVDPMGMIVFRKQENYPETPEIRTNATPQFAELLKLEAAMVRDDSKVVPSGVRIIAILDQMLAEDFLKPPDFAPAYFAALVTRFAIGRGDYALALNALRRGFVFNVEDPQLQYLSRVLDRFIDPKLLQEARVAGRFPVVTSTPAASADATNAPQ